MSSAETQEIPVRHSGHHWGQQAQRSSVACAMAYCMQKAQGSCSRKFWEGSVPKWQRKSCIFWYWFILDSQKNHNENVKINLKISPATWVLSRATIYPGFPRTVLFYNSFPIVFSHLLPAPFHSQKWSGTELWITSSLIGQHWVQHATM